MFEINPADKIHSDAAYKYTYQHDHLGIIVTFSEEQNLKARANHDKLLIKVPELSCLPDCFSLETLVIIEETYTSLDNVPINIPIEETTFAYGVTLASNENEKLRMVLSCDTLAQKASCAQLFDKNGDMLLVSDLNDKLEIFAENGRFTPITLPSSGDKPGKKKTINTP